MNQVTTHYETFADKSVSVLEDRLDGVAEIARHLQCSIDAVYYARRVGLLPIRRLGAKGAPYAFKSELDQAFKAPSTLPGKWTADSQWQAS